MAPPKPKIELPPHMRPRTLAPPSQTVCGVSDGGNLVQEIRWGVPDKASIRILTPLPNEVIKRPARLSLTVELSGLELSGSADKPGNHLRVVLDNQPSRAWYDTSGAFVIEGLTPGLHAVRVFAIDRYGEAIKSASAFAGVSFYIKSDKDAPLPVDFGQPMLTYNRPTGTYVDWDSHRVLLDFHLANTQLGARGYKVRMKLDGQAPTDLVRWGPVWLESLAPGEHTVLLELVGPNGGLVPGPYNRASGKFTIERELPPTE